MIKINLGGDQGIVDIPNWEELTRRPRFRTRIDPVKTKIKDVIGWGTHSTLRSIAGFPVISHTNRDISY